MSLWLAMTLIIVAWINFSHPTAAANCYLGWREYIPYIADNKSELCNNINIANAISLYFILSIMLIVTYDALEIADIVNQYGRLYAEWPEFVLTLIYICTLFEWFFLGGFDFKFENGAGFLHHGEIFSPIFYAIFFPSISVFIFSGINALARNKHL